MADADKLLAMLQSAKPGTRYDACEELRVAPSLSPASIGALEKATNDPDPSVRDAAAGALAAHKPSSALPGATGPTTPHESLSKASKSKGLALVLAGLGLSTLCVLVTLSNAHELQFTSGIVPLFYGTVALGICMAVWGLIELLSVR